MARRFQFYLGGVFIGTSDLETGDPPMGIASGRFIPETAYKQLQDRVISCHDNNQNHLNLKVTQHDGTAVPAVVLQLLDFSRELGEDEIEVFIAVESQTSYEILFPGYYAAYEARFKTGSSDDGEVK